MNYPAAFLAEQTSTAYMADEYGPTEWESCGQELLNRGLTIEEAEAFMFSKHMRWASDSAAGRNTADTFRAYLDTAEFGSRKQPLTLRQEAYKLATDSNY